MNFVDNYYDSQVVFINKNFIEDDYVVVYHAHCKGLLCLLSQCAVFKNIFFIKLSKEASYIQYNINCTKLLLSFQISTVQILVYQRRNELDHPKIQLFTQ